MMLFREKHARSFIPSGTSTDTQAEWPKLEVIGGVTAPGLVYNPDTMPNMSKSAEIDLPNANMV